MQEPANSVNKTNELVIPAYSEIYSASVGIIFESLVTIPEELNLC